MNLSPQNNSIILLIIKQLLVIIANCFNIRTLIIDTIVLHENVYISCHTSNDIILLNKDLIKTLQEKLKLDIILNTNDVLNLVHVYINTNLELLEKNKEILSDIQTLLKLENKYQETTIIKGKLFI